MAVGVILTPVLLSMLRRFSMAQRTRLTAHEAVDAEPRRGIYHCLSVGASGIGLYPKMLQIYDSTTVQLTERL